MIVDVAFNKIKNSGKSNQKERTLIRENILNTIDKKSIEKFQTVHVLKVFDTIVAQVQKKSNKKANLIPYGHFNVLFDEEFRNKVLIKMGFKIPSKSNNKFSKGLAFEFACIEQVNSIFCENNIKITIECSKQYERLKNNWKLCPDYEKEGFLKSGKILVSYLFEKEPILKNENCTWVLTSCHDGYAINGDVRDFFISNGSYEIGVSCKNTRDSNKNSRLSKSTNIYQAWNIREQGCSSYFMDKLLEIYQLLPEKGSTWVSFNQNQNNPHAKEEMFYEPIIKLIGSEFENNPINEEELKKFTIYILGNKSHYKIINKTQETGIWDINVCSDLPDCPSILFPTKIVNVKYEYMQKGVINKLVLECDNNWVFSLRIHNSLDVVETSFKFDTMILSSPDSIPYKVYNN